MWGFGSQQGTEYFTTVIFLVTCWQSPKEETSARVLDVYARSLGQSVFPFLQSWMSQNQKMHTSTNLRKCFAFLDWASQTRVLVTRHLLLLFLVSKLVSWCFKPSQPQGITSGLRKWPIKVTVVVKQTEKVFLCVLLLKVIYFQHIYQLGFVFTVRPRTATEWWPIMPDAKEIPLCCDMHCC